MNPLCPACLREMSKAASSPNLFHCAPCREIIQFFGVAADQNDAGRDLKTWQHPDTGSRAA